MRLRAYCCLEFGPGQQCTEDWAGFQDAAGAQAVQPDGVVADALDDPRYGVHRRCVVAGDTDGAAVGEPTGRRLSSRSW